jgi:hypothetical protein
MSKKTVRQIAFYIAGTYGYITDTDPDILEGHPYVEIQQWGKSSVSVCGESVSTGHYKLNSGIYVCTVDEEGTLGGNPKLPVQTLKICDVVNQKICKPPKKPTYTALGWM